MDTGKIRNLESAVREVLLSSRPSPAQPGARTAAEHELGHPGRNGVIVNLSSGNRDAGVDARRAAASTPGLALEIESARDTDLLSRAMRAAHTGVPATVSQALARAEEHATSGTGVAWQILADTDPSASSAPRAQSGAGHAGAVPGPAVPADAGVRADQQAGALLMTAAPGAAVASAHAEHVKHVPVHVPRPVPELVSPFLVRQEPVEPPTPYLNHVIIGAAFLGLVVILVL